jgi:hypothetical protein
MGISMAKRKSLGKKLRFEVFKRDSFTCQYCGSVPPLVILHVDHIVPVVEGGENEIDNLTTACSSCNLGKGARSLSAIPESLSDKAGRIQEQEDQLKGYADVMDAKKERQNADAWRVANIFCSAHGIDPEEQGINRDWFSSIRRFNDQIGLFECIEAMELATEKFSYNRSRCFRYFCGICWNKIREVEDGEI